MKIRGESYFLVIIMLFVLFILGWSFFVIEFLESKLLPLLIGSIVLILAAIQLGSEISRGNKLKASTSGDESGSDEVVYKEDARKYLDHGAWVAGLVLAVYVLGFIAAIFLFVLLYMNRLGARWREAIIFAVIFPAIIYGLFELALGIELYRGLVLDWLS